MARLEALLESLDLRDAAVVVHDWGGPTGLSCAVAHPERVSGLFILNTPMVPARPGQALPVLLRLFRTPGVGEVLEQGLDVFVRGFTFRDGVVYRERLTTDVRRAYLTPNPTWSSRTGELVFPSGEWRCPMHELGVDSEVDQLRSDVVPRPGVEFQRTMPSNHEDLMFSDVV